MNVRAFHDVRWPVGPPRNGVATGGYALMSVMVFVLIIIITGAAIFALASYETKGAMYRQDSSEAFYLADGAIERARGRLLDDRAWRDGWSDVAAGRGSYDLTIVDSSFAGHDDVVHILATGHIGQVARAIEVFAQVPPSALGHGLTIMGNADIKGNLCLDCQAYVGGDVGGSESHIHCGGTLIDGFEITPPWIRTEPEAYPEATYYYVRGSDLGGVYHGRIFNREGVDLTTTLGDSLIGVISYDAGDACFTYDFDSDSEIAHYFDDASGVFSRAAGDVAVVVNFGESPIVAGGAGGGGGKKGKKGGGGGGAVDPAAADALTDLVFDGGSGAVIHATIINTHFTGLSDTLRIDTQYWTGGHTHVKQVTFEPYYGIPVIAHDFERQGGSHVQMGTETWPALVYVTQDVTGLNSNFELVGCIICLGSWESSGGPDFICDNGFLENVPPFLLDEWQEGVSGTLAILRWREVAAIS